MFSLQRINRFIHRTKGREYTETGSWDVISYAPGAILLYKRNPSADLSSRNSWKQERFVSLA